MLTEECRFQEDLSCLLEGALTQGSGINSVDSMSGDGSQDTSLCHHVNEGSQMAVIHINTVRAQNQAELTNEAQSDSLDTQDLQDFVDGVTCSLGRVDTRDR